MITRDLTEKQKNNPSRKTHRIQRKTSIKFIALLLVSFQASYSLNSSQPKQLIVFTVVDGAYIYLVHKHRDWRSLSYGGIRTAMFFLYRIIATLSEIMAWNEYV